MDHDMLRIHHAVIAIALLVVVTLAWAAAETLRPTDPLAEQSGFSSTCLYSDVDDDPDSPDANWCAAANNNTSTSLRADFDTPANPTTDGSDLQEFRCAVRDNTGCGTSCATAFIALWEDGVLISTSSSTTVGASGQGCTIDGATGVIAYTWDATGRTDSLIQARCYVTKSGGSPSSRCSGDIAAVEWNADTTAAAGGRTRRTF